MDSDQVKNKKRLVKSLGIYLKRLDSKKLYQEPDHKESKDWLAEVAGILKGLDESDFNKFNGLRQHIYPSIFLPARKHASEQIEGFVRQKVAEYKNYDFSPVKNLSVSQYIHQEIIEGFVSKSDVFNYQKLVKVLNELNTNYAVGYVYSASMLIRSILDHIPPLFGYSDFKEVVNNYSWGETDLKYMKKLLDFKNEADDVLHRQISHNSDLITLEDLPTSVRINRLLQECLQIDLKKKRGVVNKLVDSTNNYHKNSDIKISIKDDTMVTWANYSQRSTVWSSFRIYLDVDNFNSKKPDYIKVSLYANNSIGERWVAKNFIFDEVGKQDQELRVEPEEMKSVCVFISDYKADSQTRETFPDIDKESMNLIIETRSGVKFDLPVGGNLIMRG